MVADGFEHPIFDGLIWSPPMPFPKQVYSDNGEEFRAAREEMSASRETPPPLPITAPRLPERTLFERYNAETEN